MTSKWTLSVCALAALVLLTGCPDRIQPTADDDTYAILLTTLMNPDNHVQQAERYQKWVTDELRWKNVFVINKSGRTELYWGRYRTPTDSKLRKNVRKARAFVAPNGQRPFATALPAPLPGRDVGPRAWNLKNVPASYTLLVATFQNAPDKNYFRRRRRAAECCKKLREQGREAYFYHGVTVSHVTLGSFGRQAVTFEVVGGVRRASVQDPRVRSLQKEFPHILINGNTETVIGQDPKTGRLGPRTKKTGLIALEAEVWDAGERDWFWRRTLGDKDAAMLR